MFIRRTQTRSTVTGESYTTYRLARSERVAGKVRQRTLLNLGRHFPVAQTYFPALCTSIERNLSGQAALLGDDLPTAVAREIERIAARLLAEQAPAPEGGDVQTVDVDSLTLMGPRSVGVEQVGLWALHQAGLEGLFKMLGLSGPQRAAAIGADHRPHGRPGLARQSSLGELRGVDFEAMSPIAALPDFR